MTELIFSYGTLQNEAIQKSLFGRTLIGMEDELIGYKMELINLSNDPLNSSVKRTYPIVIPTRNKNQLIKGFVYQLSKKELSIADEYEGQAYDRVEVTLKSGTKSWLYTKAD